MKLVMIESMRMSLNRQEAKMLYRLLGYCKHRLKAHPEAGIQKAANMSEGIEFCETLREFICKEFKLKEKKEA